MLLGSGRSAWRRFGSVAVTLAVTGLLMAPGAPAQAALAPDDCTASPTFTHRVPERFVHSAHSLTPQGLVGVAAIGSDLHTYVFLADHSMPPTVAVSALTCLGGTAVADPAVVGTPNHLRVFVYSVIDHRIHYRQSRGGTWSRWQAVPGSRAGEGVEAVATGDRTDIFYSSPLSSGYRIIHQSLVAGRWSSPEDLGGSTVRVPRVTVGPDGRFHVWVTGANDRIYVKAGTTGAWSPWRALPTGATTGAPAVTVGFEPTRQREDLFVIGTHGGLYHATVTNLGAFSGWTKVTQIGNFLDSDPDAYVSVSAVGTGRLAVYLESGGDADIVTYENGVWGMRLAPYLSRNCVPMALPDNDGNFCQDIVPVSTWPGQTLSAPQWPRPVALSRSGR